MSEASDDTEKPIPIQMLSALRRNDEGTFRALLEQHPDLLQENGFFGSWLHAAARYGLTETVRYLLAQGIDVNAVAGIPETNALFRAADHGNCEVLELLLDAGCTFDVSEAHKNPLLGALHEGNVDAAKLLIQRGIDTSIGYGDRDFTALQLARERGFTEIVEILGGEAKAGPEPIVRCDLPDWTGRSISEERLVKVESILGIEIPSHLRDFLLHDFPEQMFYPEALDDDQWKWLGPDSGLFHTARSWLAYNSENPGAETKTLAFANFFVFGTNGGGDYWCVKLDGSDKNVYLYLHEADDFEDQEQNVAEFVSDLRAAGYGRNT